MIRITQNRNGDRTQLLVEGTLSDAWVESLEQSWIQARADWRRQPVRVDLSSVTYVDDKGRDLLMRMLKDEVEVYTSGLLTRAVIAEIRKEMDFYGARKELMYI